jgi:hypothetical protein
MSATCGIREPPMKMPGAQRAVVEPTKVRDYLLSPIHPVGRFKATFFAGIGYSGENWQALQTWLLQVALSDDASLGVASEYGQKVRGAWYA